MSAGLEAVGLITNVDTPEERPVLTHSPSPLACKNFNRSNPPLMAFSKGATRPVKGEEVVDDDADEVSDLVCAATGAGETGAAESLAGSGAADDAC
jgi:hypothetical protein